MAREACPAMLMILRLVAFVDIALRCDRALRTSQEERLVCSAKPRSWNMHAMLAPQKRTARHEWVVGATAAPNCACGRRFASISTGKAVLAPRSSRTLLTNIDI